MTQSFAWTTSAGANQTSRSGSYSESITLLDTITTRPLNGEDNIIQTPSAEARRSSFCLFSFRARSLAWQLIVSSRLAARTRLRMVNETAELRWTYRAIAKRNEKGAISRQLRRQNERLASDPIQFHYPAIPLWYI